MLAVVAIKLPFRYILYSVAPDTAFQEAVADVCVILLITRLEGTVGGGGASVVNVVLALDPSPPGPTADTCTWYVVLAVSPFSIPVVLAVVVIKLPFRYTLYSVAPDTAFQEAVADVWVMSVIFRLVGIAGGGSITSLAPDTKIPDSRYKAGRTPPEELPASVKYRLPRV